MDQTNLSRRGLISAAAAIGVGSLTVAEASAQEKGEQKQPPSPSTTYAGGTLRLGADVRAELLDKFRALRMRDAELAPGLTKSDVIALLEGEATEPGGVRVLSVQRGPTAEKLIRPLARPVLFIRNGTFDTSGLQLAAIRMPLERAKGTLDRAIAAVGRIELQNHPEYSWVGTAWRVEADVVVTNRHVAEVFARATQGGFTFRRGIAQRPITARVDFLREYVPLPAENQFLVTKVLHIEPDEGLDFALLQVKDKNDSDGPLPGEPIALSDEAVAPGKFVGVIGYPGYDSRAEGLEAQEMQALFQGIYNYKRLSPGELMSVSDVEIQHDASTLPGNSGSAVIDPETGRAVALHWGGTYKQANYAVPAKAIAARLRATSRRG